MADKKIILDERALNEMDELLQAYPEDKTMDLAMLDGFLTAAILNPDHPSEEEYLPFIFDPQGNPEAIPDNERLMDMICARRNEIAAALVAGNGLEPIIFPIVDDNDEIETGPEGIVAIEPWALGFLAAYEQWPDEAAQDTQVEELMGAIARHVTAESFENVEDAKEFLKTYDTMQNAPKDLEEALVSMVKAIFEIKAIIDPNKPLVREEPRVGRNDPCPCGSGKKYKQCCAKK